MPHDHHQQRHNGAGQMQDEFDAWEDAVFEDVDHEMLFNPAFDGIDESEIAERLGIVRLKFSAWVVPFDAGVVSPYSEDGDLNQETRDGEAH